MISTMKPLAFWLVTKKVLFSILSMGSGKAHGETARHWGTDRPGLERTSSLSIYLQFKEIVLLIKPE